MEMISARMDLSFPLPFGDELVEESFEEGVALGGEAFSGGGVHAVFEEQEFFVEMVNRRAGVLFVGLERSVRLGWNGRIVERAAFVTAVGEGASYSDEHARRPLRARRSEE